MPEKSPSRQSCWLGKLFWIFIIIAIVGIGGRFLFFKVESNPFQLPMTAYDWTGFGESYDQDVLTVTETATETLIPKQTTKNATETPSTKQTIKTIKTTNRLQPSKTFWDWMSLFLAPATLTGLGLWFQYSQEKAKRDKEDADKKRELARQQEQAERQAEKDAEQQREQMLQAYYDLFVDKKLGAVLLYQQNRSSDDVDRGSDPQVEIDTELHAVKAKTLSLFRAFEQDIPRKSSVLSFLDDCGLLIHLKLDLSSSNWTEANLRSVNLSKANLTKADLSNANLLAANLHRINLLKANLSKANLRYANLTKADLTEANLSEADLRYANLSYADLRNNIDHRNDDDSIGALLSYANLRRANLSYANLRRADLSGADLREADLSGADLRKANLSKADLSDAKLIGANLIEADLSDAIIDIQQVKSAKSCQSAIFSDAIRAELDKSISQKKTNY